MNPRLRSPLTVIVLLAWHWVASPATQAAEKSDAEARLEQGASRYVECAKCHGERAEGNETSQAPRLAGREDWYLRRQLKKFRELQRGYEDPKDGQLPAEDRTRFMHPVATSLSSAATEALIDYIRTRALRPVPPHPQGDPERGRKLFANCLPCHGVNGEGSRRQQAPRIQDQHGWYLFNQIRDFRMGWRGTDPRDVHGKLMRGNTDLDDAAIHDLAAYITTLAQPRK